jgi:hypothetical protein
MTIHFRPKLEWDILAAVHGGRYASLDDAMSDAAYFLNSSAVVNRYIQEANTGYTI